MCACFCLGMYVRVNTHSSLCFSKIFVDEYKIEMKITEKTALKRKFF